jgi:hypothetical protein
MKSFSADLNGGKQGIPAAGMNESPSIRTDVHNRDIDIRKLAFVTSLDQAARAAAKLSDRILISRFGIDQIQ